MKKKVLIINGHLDVGGCEKSLIEVLKNFDYQKYEVDLLLLEHLGDYINEVPQNVNIKLYSLNNAFGRWNHCLLNAFRNHDWFSFKFRIEYTFAKKMGLYHMSHIRKLFKDLNNVYDVIIAYRPGICTELAAFCFHAAKKISWWHHGEMNLSANEINIFRRAYKKIDKIVAVSTSSATILSGKFPEIENKLCIISNIIDFNELMEKAKEYKPIEYEKAQFKIISVGRMSPEKNMILCPEIGKCLIEAGIKFKWIIIGDGIEKNKINNNIIKYNLQEHMILIGKKKNPYPYIATADIMIHPSLVESQGITIMESMELYTPVIAVCSEGPKEYIKNGENGYLVNSDEEEITKLVLQLYTTPQKRKEIAYRAFDEMKKFEATSIMPKIKKLIE